MKDFRLFDLMDFVMDEDFIRWVHEKKAADDKFWNEWLGQNPEKHLIVAEARRILETVKTGEKVLSDDEIDFEIERLLQIVKGLPEQDMEPVRQIPVKKTWWLAAAVLAALIAGGWYLMQNASTHQIKSSYTAIIATKQLVEHTNTSATPITITLEDGSRVELAANSSISYAKKLDTTGSRDVYLSGEAFFNVTKNPSRPFRVFANEIITKVLGTSFGIRSFEKDSVIKVTVKTGKVSVYAGPATSIREAAQPGKLSGIILTCNQQLVYEKAGQKFQRILADNPEIITGQNPADIRTVYEDAPLERVFQQLTKEYGINIVYDADLLKNCTVTADLTGESFYHKLDLISKAVGARYEVIDGQVVVQSGGCL